MARSYAQISGAMFDGDSDFAALEPAAQITYVYLLTRPLTLCGVLPLTIVRWAGNLTAGDTVEMTRRLQALQQAKFVLVDLDTEELLIRTFVRGDGVLRNPKLITGMVNDFPSIVSRSLQNELLLALPEGLFEGAQSVEMVDRYRNRQAIDRVSMMHPYPFAWPTDSIHPSSFILHPSSFTEPEAPLPARKQRVRDPLFDALVIYAEGVPRENLTSLTSRQARAVGVATAEIKRAGGEPAMVRSACDAYRRQFPGATLTANALASHWATCQPGSGHETPPPTRRPTAMGSSASSRQASAQDAVDERLASMDRDGNVLAIGSGS